ncbi:MAG: NADH-quinone oxidoreductase subunit NuoN [Actinobacteria bacterium]|jgi:NADH-quinone oxidoreductase subunit N|nr:NADH-quinone oxidoreductase subunit NuoN [Actinomycetota bacterium]
MLAPILVVLAGALIGVLIEAFAPQRSRSSSQLLLAVFTLIVALLALIRTRGTYSNKVAMNSVTFDGAGYLLQMSILIIALIAILLLADSDKFAAAPTAAPGSDEERQAQAANIRVTEIYPLTLFAIAGMLLFTVSSDLITLFVALEVLSLPLYLMAGLARRRRLASQEAALKYFLLGAFSSAFFLFGIAYLYGYSDSITFAGIAAAITGGAANDVFLLIGISFVSVGLLFKVSAVPFHSWAPDVYQGAPTAVTAFMAAATKVAAFGAMLRIFYVAFAGDVWQWRPMLTAVALVTMVFGSLVAISQRDVKRMLAYSSIAHAGFLLSGIIALNKSGLDATIFYLFAYGVATVGAFAIVSLVSDSSGEVSDLNRWAGLGKRSPWIATSFAFLLLTFAGIPLTSGFVGKFAIFSAAYESGNTAILITGVLSSAIAAFFYIRIIVLIFFKDPVEDGTSVVIPSMYTRITIVASLIITLVLGVFPAPVLDYITQTAFFLR